MDYGAELCLVSQLSIQISLLSSSCECLDQSLDLILHRVNNRIKIKINATSSTKVKTLNEIAGAGKGSSSLATSTEIGHLSQEQIRQRIPTKKQLVDPYRQGLIIERGVGYRQTVVVRSYEVGPYKTATLESLLNLFQDF